MSNAEHGCTYSSRAGKCSERAMTGGLFCFWHAPDVDKTGPGVREKLEKRAMTGIPMDGFILRGANLENLNLVNAKGVPHHLTNTDLSRANLHNAHLYKVDLSGSSLLKADLSGANLHRASLMGCNLLGVNLKACRLEHVDWGDEICQATLAESVIAQEIQDANSVEKAALLYEEAEEVARNIRKSCERQGVFDIAGDFFHREMQFRRYQLPRFSLRRFVSKGVDIVSGYGEKPERIVLFSAFFIFICSLFYFGFGINGGSDVIQLNLSLPWTANVYAWLECLYFSVVTFTTLGYGDLSPLGPSRFFAAMEAFIGSFSLALFVVVFVKKMTR